MRLSYEPACRRGRLWVVSYVKNASIVFLLIFLDQVSKHFAIQHGIASINTGVSFQLFSGQHPFTYLLVAFIFLGLVYFFSWPKRQLFLVRAALALVTAGAASNILDRFLYGGVVDFLPIPFTGIHNNFADWMIGVGLILIIISQMQNEREY